VFNDYYLNVYSRFDPQSDMRFHTYNNPKVFNLLKKQDPAVSRGIAQTAGPWKLENFSAENCGPYRSLTK